MREFGYSREISVLFVEFLTRLLQSFTGETVKTTTDQKNLSIIASDNVHISSQK